MKTSGRDVVADQAKNFNVIVSSSASLCDNTQRNLLHLNNGIAVDQQQPTPSIVYSNSQLRAIGIKAEDGQTHHLHGDISSMSNYRNPRPIHPPLSPVMPGSSTPIDIVGSLHSPSVSGSTQSYPDAMAMAGPNYQHFTELTNDVQKLTMLETQPNSGQGMPAARIHTYS